MDNQMTYTDTDLQKLWMINPLASEQLKNIVLTRINSELQEQKKCTCSDNGTLKTAKPEDIKKMQEMETVTEG
tara:strand:- start:327 stop:545 length:219 start_codon:yes stop_codon:yes gene_type:complete